MSPAILLTVGPRAAYRFAATLEYVCIDHGGTDIFMAEQLLHRANIVTVLQEMRSKAVPQRMDGAPCCGEPGSLFGGPEGALDTGATHRGGCGRALSLVAPRGGKEPGEVAVGFPVGAEQCQCIGGQGDVPVFGALAAVDMDPEALAIDVGDLKVQGFMELEAQAVDGGEIDLVVEGGSGRKEPPDLLDTEDGGETVCSLRTQERQRVPIALEDVLIEEADAALADTHGCGGQAIDTLPRGCTTSGLRLFPWMVKTV
jgi:hypothetical protein